MTELRWRVTKFLMYTAIYWICPQPYRSIILTLMRMVTDEATRKMAEASYDQTA